MPSCGELLGFIPRDALILHTEPSVGDASRAATTPYISYLLNRYAADYVYSIYSGAALSDRQVFSSGQAQGRISIYSSYSIRAEHSRT